MLLLSLFLLILKTFFFLILFITCISFLGITTGVRKAYVYLLLWLFEQMAKLEKETTNPTTFNIETTPEKNLEQNSSQESSSKESTPATTPQDSDKFYGIIKRKWSRNIENKLVEHVGNSNVHPLAQKVAKRVASHAKGLKLLAEEGNEINDAEYATIKVLAADTLAFITSGIEAIIEDDVTQRFEAAQLPTWNFLSRSRGGLRVRWYSYCIWATGAFIRYGLLFPFRFSIFISASFLMGTLPALVGYIPNESLRSCFYQLSMLMCMRMCMRAFSTIITFHGEENKPKNGISVANHTSPIDVMILSTDNCYAMVGQRHDGFLGLIEKALDRGAHHIWFERAESKDRHAVAKKLQEHVKDPSKMPILIFPEGTCINNTSVMLFKKGSFEVSSVVHPIALKYDSRLGDPFWNSHRQGYLSYLLGMMTSWALICDVWYLPPMHRLEGETSISFARRCQRTIAQKGGLVDLGWDGNLKRTKVPERLRDEQKELFYQYLVQTTPICECGRASNEQIESIQRGIHPEVFNNNEQKTNIEVENETND
uniref:Phospholipid/glycerol acyltransferase domain-containing protein n=1 Tax=Meloidogyne incognita TaxID=6306 RepID=A0A914KXJ9_MELIC